MFDFFQFYTLTWLSFIDLILFFSILGGIKLAFDTLFNGLNPMFILILLFVFMGTFQNQWELLDNIKDNFEKKEITDCAVYGIVFGFFNFFILPICVCAFIQENFRYFNINFFKSCYFSWLPSNILLCFQVIDFSNFFDFLMCLVYVQCLQFVALFSLKHFIDDNPIFNCSLS